LRRLLPVCLLALLAACASRSQTDKSDWELQHQGELVREAADAAPAPELPPYPRRENLTEFFVSSASDFRFFIDRGSIDVKDRVVRYVLVARSPSGVDNVSFEAINCAAGEYRIYARGRSDDTWTSRPGGWQKIVPRSVQRWHNALYAEFFCPAGVAIADAAEGVRALERGANPLSAAPNSKGAVGSSPAF
jgi:hypothetical protein